MPIDFGILDKKILIELDGEQHFSQVSNWDAPENVQGKYAEKIKLAIQNGYSIIHLCQLDVWYDTYDWKSLLFNIINTHDIHNTKCVFIQLTDMYIKHIELIGDTPYDIINPKKYKTINNLPTYLHRRETN
jgi:hypothetical protein